MLERVADTDSVEVTLTASRALLGVVARSVTEVLHTVTLPQFRVLVVLSGTGPLRIGTLAERMKANPSTFSRTIDRMVVHGWVDRATSADSRREVLVQITAEGRALVDQVTEKRRHDISAILGRLSPADQKSIAAALALFTEAAGEPHANDLLTLGL